MTQWLHNVHSEIIYITFPLGNSHGFIRCGGCGCTEQCIFYGNDPNGTEDDAVLVMVRESVFHGIRYIVEPRGNCMTLIGGSVAQLENIVAQTPRTWTLTDLQKQLRDTFTMWFYFNHMNVASQMAADATSAGNASEWFVDVDMPHTYGSTQADGLHVPDATVFANDEFGLPARGGDMIAARGPRPQVVQPGTWGFAASRQAIETFAAFNQFGQMFPGLFVHLGPPCA